MIIKEAYGNDNTIETLEALAARSDCTPETRQRIEREIRNVKAGMRGERDAAYEMKVHWGDSSSWMVIHDLRLTAGNLVAQFDHLLINRLLEIYVCESKHFSEGVAINEHGEFSGFFNNRPFGVPSPIAQNQKHVLFLKKFFDSDAVTLPTRFGFPMKPELKSVVLVSKNARISRPRKKIDGLDTIIKMDQLFKYVGESMDKNDVIFSLVARLIGGDTLEAFARRLAGKHVPLEMNWAAKFGMSTMQVASAALDLVAHPPAAPAPKVPAPAEGSSKLVCHGCAIAVPMAVARFCWSSAKFKGHIYCRVCQPKVSLGRAPQSVAEAPAPTPVVAPVAVVPPPVPEVAAPAPAEGSNKLVCFGCASAVPLAVARFCWFNKAKFDGNIFCRDCQSGQKFRL